MAKSKFFGIVPAVSMCLTEATRRFLDLADFFCPATRTADLTLEYDPIRTPKTQKSTLLDSACFWVLLFHDIFCTPSKLWMSCP